jgi:hypothetical protein
MSNDLNGGLPDDADLAVIDPPDDDPYFGENHALWLWDAEQSVGMHVYLKTLGHVTSFRQRRESVYVFLPDGTVVTSDQDGPGATHPAIARGPNLECECLEPFRRWQFRYDSTGRATTAAELRQDVLRIAPPRALSFSVDVTMAAPPWMLGTYSVGEHTAWASQFFGGQRYEQLLTAIGRITFEGRTYEVGGVGMRTHRVGRRNTGTFPGHTWLTGLFADGRSFGLQKFCGADGVAKWQEAWVSDGRERVPADILAAPLFSQRLPGEELLVTLASARGRTTIVGTLAATNFVTTKQPDPQKFLPGMDRHDPTSRLMSQGLARYEWDGAPGAGMIERSVRVEELGPVPDAE